MSVIVTQNRRGSREYSSRDSSFLDLLIDPRALGRGMVIHYLEVVFRILVQMVSLADLLAV